MRGLPSLLYTGDAGKEIPASVIVDLNLDKLLPEEACTILRHPCTPEDILARQEIFRHLQNPRFEENLSELSDALSAFAQSRTAMDAAKSELEELFLFRGGCIAFSRIFRAVLSMTEDTSSRILLQLRDYFESLRGVYEQTLVRLDETASTIGKLSLTDASFDKSASVRLTAPAGESLCTRLEKHLCAAGVTPHPAKRLGMRIESELSGALSLLYPEAWEALRAMRSVLRMQIPGDIGRLRGGIDFYRAVSHLLSRGKAAGLACCYPTLSDIPGYRANNACDCALLIKNTHVIPNDIDFDAESDVCFLTGANGGGKTTYLRCVASNLLLALNGCPVFAESMEVYPFRYLCTHFPADESFTGSGRLVEEAARVDDMLAYCLPGSFVFLNETYSGTDDVKGAELTLACAARLKKMGAFALYVTHFHEVASHGFTMLTTVMDETDSANRTFRIVKRRGTDSSFAKDVLKKYRLDAESLERPTIKSQALFEKKAKIFSKRA